MLEALVRNRARSAVGEPYWDGARLRQLVLQRCGACGKLQHPPRIACGHCGSRSVEPAIASGRGEVISYTVVERALIPELRDAVPYTLVLVALEEDVRVLALLTGPRVPEVSIGDRVEVDFLSMGQDVLPVFRLRSE